MATPQLLDQYGRPVDRTALTRREPAGAVTVRSPISGYPADGMTPVRLAAILREADQGDPLRFLELAEAIEERDPHYLGVLGTRRRSVAQLDITVEPASDKPEDTEKADRIREWLKRDELQDEVFNVLDAIGKGYSVTRIHWEVSEGQWAPARLTQEDPRSFRFDRETLRTPVELTAQGQEVPLQPFQYVFAEMKAKSGLTLRSGLARIAAWAWMFKAFTQRDWAIFSQTYGQPLRVGKYGAGASQDDRDTLFNAVANIAGDCAAIIPESMLIEFVETKNAGSSSDLYEKRSDWLDRQISKAVLGQTTTTDASAGGHALGRTHRLVQEDIETADAKSLSSIINRDLVRPWVQLEWGPQKAYPRLVIGRPEAEDLKQMTESLNVLVPLGMEVSEEEVRGKLGLSKPKAGDRILGARPVGTQPPGLVAPSDVSNGGLTGVDGLSRTGRALQAEGPSAGGYGAGSPEGPDDPSEALADRLAIEADPAVAGMVDQVEAMMMAAGSLPEFREMLLAGFGALDAGELAAVLQAAMTSGLAGGHVAVLEEEAALDG